MELVDLEKLAKTENIDVINYRMHKTKARIINHSSVSILIDYKQINTYTEEKCLLAEELGHYYHDSYYTVNSSQIDVDRAEYRANKWKCLVCVTKQSLINCFKKGLSNCFEIAEQLQVEPDMVRFAYDYYFVK